MTTAVFSSLDGRLAHQTLILGEIAQAGRLAVAAPGVVTLQIMCFAFTDQAIADALGDLVQIHANVQIKVIADWSQGAPASPSVTRALAQAHPGQIHLRYKIDLPYIQDKTTGYVRWNYASSHGMLHHKTMCICTEDTAQRLLIGSYNWSARGTQAYENTMVLQRDGQNEALLSSFSAEFASLWDNPAVTARPDEVAELALAARKLVQAGGNLHDVDDIASLMGSRIDRAPSPRDTWLENGPVLPAFSGRYLTDTRAHYGYAPKNAARKLNLLRPSGVRKLAPVTLNSVALEAIRSVPDGDPINVAMYALSPRVPEYSALLEAARRGCPLKILLDGKIGGSFANSLAQTAQAAQLPIEVRTTNRRMHQKYLVAPAQNTVVTGTANMTEDATSRHSEHRILFRNDPYLGQRFNEDFNTIWGRLDRSQPG